MDKLRFFVFSVITLGVLGLFGYWAVMTLQSGSGHVSKQELKELKNTNQDLEQEVASLRSELAIYKPAEKKPEETIEDRETPAEIEVPTKPANTAYNNQTLIHELQKLITDKVGMKLKSRGTRVGTVQHFLNIYNNTSNQIDNDYGPSIKKAVAAFQKAEGLNADGEAGESTFIKMIDWLKKQG